jgi:16S rRNA (uracil1498-N3)-methyltransferase
VNPALRRSAAHVFVDDLAAPELAADDAHHLTRVLRVGPRDVISVGDGAGSWLACTVQGSALVPAGPVERVEQPSPPITIAVAVPKGDRPEWIVQKLTEVGVDAVVFFHAARSVVRWDAERAARQQERLRRVAREAAMQSRRLWVPDVTVTSVMPPAGDAVACAEPDGSPLTLATPTVVVGPEGGWTAAELECFPVQVSLGPTVLRVETAALAAGVRLTALRDATT